MSSNLTWKNIDFKSVDDLKKFEIELNRRIRQYFLKINEAGATATFSDVLLTGLAGDIISSTSVKTSLEELDAELYKIQNAAIKIVTTTDTLTAADRGTIHLNDSAVGSQILNLPTAVGNEFLSYHITNINTEAWTIDPFEAQNIHGDSTIKLYQDENIILQSNNVGWWVK